MTDTPHLYRPNAFARLFDRVTQSFADWRNGKIADSEFQAWAGRFPLTRRLSRRTASEVYDLVSGFVYSQTLLACVELDLLEIARHQAIDPVSIAVQKGVQPQRMTALCQAAAALELLTRQHDGCYRLGRLGAAVIGVPGLELMIRHHKIFYRDLVDPTALLRGEKETELSRYWPYVNGNETHDLPTESARTYSELMRTSQQIVAAQTLQAVSLDDVSHLLDLGGGTGAFLSAVAAQYSAINLTLFELPAVAHEAVRQLDIQGLAYRVDVSFGSFLDNSLPVGADAISLIRVLYDHDDSTVRPLLRKVYEALPDGGRVLISEPMSGGVRPAKAGDAYFGFYTMAMTTGCPRSAERHAELLEEAGFSGIEQHPTDTPFVTSVITARKI